MLLETLSQHNHFLYLPEIIVSLRVVNRENDNLSPKIRIGFVPG